MSQPNTPLQGIKLQQIVEELVEYYGWGRVGQE